VARYKTGETKLVQFFLGQVMKTSRGKADPKLAHECWRRNWHPKGLLAS